jgi:DNA-binding NarL/FixJ family response regulator
LKNSPDPITQQIPVVLADDQPVVKQGLATILQSPKDIYIVVIIHGAQGTRSMTILLLAP